MSSDEERRRPMGARLLGAVAITVAVLGTTIVLATRDTEDILVAGEGPADEQAEPTTTTTTTPTTTATSSVPTTTVVATAAQQTTTTFPSEPRASDALAAVLTSEPDTATSGRVLAEPRDGTSWWIVVTVVGADPGRSYGVMVGRPIGEWEQPTVCSFTADHAGAGRCEGTMDAWREGPLTTVSVLGDDPPSKGFRAVASGSFS